MINEHAHTSHTYYFITRSHVQMHNIILCAYILYEMGSI